MTDTRVHRSTLERSGPFGALTYEQMANIVAGRFGYKFGATCERPDLLLVRAGSGWEGTFGVVLRTVLDDVLNRDPAAAPWPISLIRESEKGPQTLETVVGLAARFDPDTDEVTFSNGLIVRAEDIVAIAA